MLKRNLSLVISCLALTGLTGCASIVSGTNQRVSVKTGQITGARCSLQNSKGRWFINQTPGDVSVNRSNDNLLVQCKKSGVTTRRVVASSANPAAFGNVVMPGGVIGAGIDMADGAAYKYTDEINMPMKHA